MAISPIKKKVLYLKLIKIKIKILLTNKYLNLILANFPSTCLVSKPKN